MPSRDVFQATAVFLSPPRYERKLRLPRKSNGFIYGSKGVAGFDLWRQKEKGKRPLSPASHQARDLHPSPVLEATSDFRLNLDAPRVDYQTFLNLPKRRV